MKREDLSVGQPEGEVILLEVRQTPLIKLRSIRKDKFLTHLKDYEGGATDIVKSTPSY